MQTRFRPLVIFFLVIIHTGWAQTTDRYPIIPRPAQLQARTGEFLVSRTTTVLVPPGQTALRSLADTFVAQLNQAGGLGLTVRVANRMAVPGNIIQFIPATDTTLGKEGYRIDITDKLVTIEAGQANGFFYAVQTLRQLLPAAALADRRAVPDSGLTTWSLPACRIEDRPRYVYRGMNLDVCRHFFPVSFLKKYIDLMALHKINTFHWHLTDDQGWRIEIKKYPRLTQVGSVRRETLVGHYDDYDPQVFDGKPYSGFYTQDEIREVVRYAAARYVTVVPEIEMPGHALAALTAYPELGCTPGPFAVATKWGVFDDVFCPTEKTFTFLENVLTEVMALFPGKYIHIGGDECPKTAWRNSAFCQNLMKREGLKNENELQSYFIRRIDKFVTGKGRRIIGWDEILEGGLSPNATVMSWRGTKGGLDAARQHHDVVMTPGAFCYLDHYQGDPAQEPTGFGGSLPLAQVYSYNPTPTELSATDATHILGVQGNVWTEYIPSVEQAEYMIWPRAAALAEVAWSPLALKNYDDFARRLPALFGRLTSLRVNVARTVYDAIPVGKATADGRVSISLLPETRPAGVTDIRYTTDGTPPTNTSMRYTGPISIDQPSTIRTAAFSGDLAVSRPDKVQKDFLVSKATGKSYTLQYPATTGRPDKNQPLTNGVTVGMGGYEVVDIVSFAGDFGATVDLGQVQPVQGVRVGFLKYTAKNMCLPRQIEVSVSADGQTFTPVSTVKTNAAENGKRAIVRLPVDFAATSARYVRIVARNVGTVPAGMRTPGKAAQLAVDEIEIR
ncbi:family 20 glycosylhydrolase [Spirosoma luteolum]